jgi:hypothetical protein
MCQVPSNLMWLRLDLQLQLLPVQCSTHWRRWLCCLLHPAALPELDIRAPAGFPYPLQLKLSQLFWTLLELALMLWGLAWSVRTWCGMAARLAGMLRLGVAGLQVSCAVPLLRREWSMLEDEANAVLAAACVSTSAHAVPC